MLRSKLLDRIFNRLNRIMASEPHPIIERMFDVLPPIITPSTLEEYGVDTSPQQAHVLAQEILGLSLYWIACALRVSFKQHLSQQMWQDLCLCIRERWDQRLGLDLMEREGFFLDLPAKQAMYDDLTRGGSQPIDLIQHTIHRLETEGTITSTDGPQVLAFLVDVVPVEGVGEVIGQIEEEMG